MTNSINILKDPFPSFANFKAMLADFSDGDPNLQLHLNVANKRIYVTLKELVKHFKDGCKIVDMGCLPINNPIGMKLTGLWQRCEYLGLCSEQPVDEDFQFAQKMGMKMEPVNLDPHFKMFDHVTALDTKCSLPDNSVDIVIATEVLEHMVWPHSLLQEAHRLLKPGGVIIATTPNATNPGVLMKCIIGRGAFESYNNSHLRSNKWMQHVRFYSFIEMNQLLNDNGFLLAQKKYLCNTGIFYGNQGLSSRISRTIRRLLYIVPWWREGLFFVAQKK